MSTQYSFYGANKYLPREYSGVMRNSVLDIRYERLNRRGSLSAAERSPNAAQQKLYRRRRVYTDDPHISPPQYIMPASYKISMQYADFAPDINYRSALISLPRFSKHMIYM